MTGTPADLFLANRAWQRVPLQLKRVSPLPEFDWYVDPAQLIDTSILRGVWEPYTTWAIEQLVKPGWACLDVGANIGYYTVLLQYLTGSQGAVHSFETMRVPRLLIAEHVKRNEMSCPCTIHAFGLSDHDEVTEGFTNYSWPPQLAFAEKEQISLRRLDDLDISRIDFMKIDVDGPEYHVLLGAERVLKEHRPALLLEVCDYTLRQAWGHAADAGYVYGTMSTQMLKYLTSIGYKFLAEETMTPAPSVEELLQQHDLSKQSINLVCV